MEYIKQLFLPLEVNNYRPGILEKKFFFVLVIFLFGVKILSFISYEKFLGADIFNSINQTDLYSLTNDTRQENQLSPLKSNSKLEMAAKMKLNDMLQNNYFAHVSPSGVTPWVWIGKSNYDYVIAGENLAMNFYNSSDTMKAWLNSELHRKNILLPEFKEIGIAVGTGTINNQKTTVVVQVFGSPKIEPITQIVRKPLQPKPIATKVTIFNASGTMPVVSPIAQVKSDINFNDDKSDFYAVNLFLQGFMVIMFAIILAIMLLKIVVNINIQIPELVLRGVVLIFLSVAFVTIKDSQILHLLHGNIIL